jgi:tetratricopeptide (TPR) repeat protein
LARPGRPAARSRRAAGPGADSCGHEPVSSAWRGHWRPTRRARRQLECSPHPSTVLAAPAAVAARRVLDALPADTQPEARAEWLNNLSVRLADLGRPEQALAAIEEAVTTYRQLAAARPDAFLPHLATSLNNLSNRLADLGRPEQALTAIEEAATTRRQLAAARPDAFLPHLARSLNNLSNRLADLGDLKRADACRQEAEAILGRRLE